MNISSNYTLVVNFTNSVVGKNFLKIVTDEQLYDSVSGCVGYYYDAANKKSMRITSLSCASVASRSNNSVTDIITVTDTTGKLSLSSLEISYFTPQYQTVLVGSEVKVMYELPTTSYNKKYNIFIAGISLSASLTYSSLAANTFANYSLSVTPIGRNGVVSVELPPYISDLYNGDDSSSLSDDTIVANMAVTVNGNSVPLLGINNQPITNMSGLSNLYLLSYSPISLTYTLNIFVSTASPSMPRSLTIALTNVLNPNDNRVLQFRVYQHEYELQPVQVYGYRQFDVVVTGLPLITVYSGIRNGTKIGAPI